MEAKTSDWRPGPSVCRCCLTEGCYKDISTEYFWMGKKEIYSEMLSDTFSISIAYSQSGPNSNSRLICEPCIARLRDASDFRRQVVECEKTFMQHLDPGTSSSADIEILAETVDYEVKLERVKTEKPLSDDDFDDADFLDDDDDDDMDDEPLTKLASKVPKKESVDLLDLLDNSKPSLKRKSATKVKASPTKKSKTKKDTAKPATSKVTKPEKKKKDVMHPLASIARRNANIIVKYTTAYPFRLPGATIVCAYCHEQYPDPTQFREHMDLEHESVVIETAFAHCTYDVYLKTDCTKLRCRVCSEAFVNLDVIAKHLIEVHDKTINLNADLGVHPFILETDKFLCGICEVKFPCIRQLSRHMSSHYQNFTCDTCGKMYTTYNALQQHIRFSHIKGETICRKCKNTFDSIDAKREHVLASSRCWPYHCYICSKRFIKWSSKEEHLSFAHGKEKKCYPCPECEKVFESRYAYRIHFETIHAGIKYECSHCGRQFNSKTCLRQHDIVHNKTKMYPCTVCSKTFPRKDTLTQHMWVHCDYSRFECNICKRKFKRNDTLKAHMRTHPEITT